MRIRGGLQRRLLSWTVCAGLAAGAGLDGAASGSGPSPEAVSKPVGGRYPFLCQLWWHYWVVPLNGYAQWAYVKIWEPGGCPGGP
jgi:hypothetical protein